MTFFVHHALFRLLNAACWVGFAVFLKIHGLETTATKVIFALAFPTAGLQIWEASDFYRRHKRLQHAEEAIRLLRACHSNVRTPTG